MCEMDNTAVRQDAACRTVPVTEAVGMVLAHDITEIRDQFKGRAFKKGHIVRSEDICHLQRLGKENLFVLSIRDDEMHEDDAALALADALMGAGVRTDGEPREGRINIIAERDGLLRIDAGALYGLNLLGEVMCATLHDNMPVKAGQVVAGTRAVPLIVKKDIVRKAVAIAERAGGIVRVVEVRRPKAGIVITGNEVFYGRIRDAFAPVVARKIEAVQGEVIGIAFAPDDETAIEARLREFIAAGADLLITTGGMSVDPDDVTRFAIRRLGAEEITYGAAVLPGSMFLIAYLPIPDTDATIPVLGIPACGMHSRTTVFDLVLPRVLAGERIGRGEIAALGHGGLCMKCDDCRYPVCPFGK